MCDSGASGHTTGKLGMHLFIRTVPPKGQVRVMVGINSCTATKVISLGACLLRIG